MDFHSDVTLFDSGVIGDGAIYYDCRPYILIVGHGFDCGTVSFDSETKGFEESHHMLVVVNSFVYLL